MKMQKVMYMYVCQREGDIHFLYLCLVYIFKSLNPWATVSGVLILSEPMKGLGAMGTPKKDLQFLRKGSTGGKSEEWLGQ